MKNTSILALMFIALSAFAPKIPEAVTKAFNQKFPTAMKVNWEKEGKKVYEAEFTLDGKEASANFSSTGEWLETEKEIPATDLPQKVQAAFKTFCGDCKIDISKAEEIQTSTGKTKYEIEYKLGKKTKEVVFDSEGNKLK